MATSSPEEFSVERLAAEATERAVRQLARGCSFEGLSYEIAFRAVVAGGADRTWINAFARVAASELAESIDALPDAAAAAAARARAAHEREWPHDCPGAELAAKLAAVEEAEQLLAEAYARILDELTPAVGERRRGRLGGRRVGGSRLRARTRDRRR